ncbi:MAG: hypothetical protein Q8K55_08915 [Gemmatimonadaceae bacterium]|nr:hypothetical protein [Gemmatimonadaceae bacterium]
MHRGLPGLGNEGSAMELTARRAAALALAAFALLVIARPPRPTGMTYYQARNRASAVDRAREAQDATRDTLRVVNYALWSGQVRDSVRRVLAGAPEKGRDRAFIDPRVPAATRAHIDEVYAATRARMSAGRMALPIFVVLDTTLNYSLGTTLWVEDAAGPAPACATLLRVRVSREAMRDTRQMSRDIQRVVPARFPQPEHFGLCGFEAEFGAPSADVRRWLEEREYRPIASGYDARRTPRVLRDSRGDVLPYFNSANNGAMALALRACFAGRSARCLDAVAPVSDRPVYGPVGGLSYVVSDWRWYRWGWYGSPDLMNTLAASMGAESFGAMWRGNASPPDAYQQLTGVSMDTLARRVLVGDAPPLGVGASLSLASVITPLLIAAVFAGLATLAHPRRRKP